MSRFKRGDVVRSSGKFSSDEIETKHYLILGIKPIAFYQNTDDDCYLAWWIEGGKEINIVLNENPRFHDEVIYESNIQEGADGTN